MEGHPIRDRPDYRTHALPFSTHGDGVPIAAVGKTWQKSCEAYSFASAIGVGPTLLMNFVIGFIFKAMAVEKTYETFMTILVWSLYWMSLGQWPDRDWNGIVYVRGTFEYHLHHTVKWLANKFYGILWIIRGDLE